MKILLNLEDQIYNKVKKQAKESRRSVTQQINTILDWATKNIKNKKTKLKRIPKEIKDIANQKWEE